MKESKINLELWFDEVKKLLMEKYKKKLEKYGDTWIDTYNPDYYPEDTIDYLKKEAIEHIKNGHFIGAGLFTIFLHYLSEIENVEDFNKFWKNFEYVNEDVGSSKEKKITFNYKELDELLESQPLRYDICLYKNQFIYYGDFIEGEINEEDKL